MRSSLPRRLVGSGSPLLPFSLLLEPTPPPALLQCHKHLLRLYRSLFLPDLDLLTKMRYKQKNQHRQATWWRHLTAVQRFGNRVREEFEHDLTRSWDPTELKATKEENLERCAVATLRVSLLIEKSTASFIKATAALDQLLRASLFMPLALTLKALVCRLHSTFHLFQMELANWIIVVRSLLKKQAISNGKAGAPNSGGSPVIQWDHAMTKLPQELKLVHQSITKRGRASEKRGSSASVGLQVPSSVEPLSTSKATTVSREDSMQASSQRGSPAVRVSPASVVSRRHSPAYPVLLQVDSSTRGDLMAEIATESQRASAQMKRKKAPTDNYSAASVEKDRAEVGPAKIKKESIAKSKKGERAKKEEAVEGTEKKKVKRRKAIQEDDIDAIFGGV